MSDLKRYQVIGYDEYFEDNDNGYWVKAHEVQATIAELQSENKKLRKIIALSEDNNKTRWVKPKKKFWNPQW
jgi:hypothetical protein